MENSATAIMNSSFFYFENHRQCSISTKPLKVKVHDCVIFIGQFDIVRQGLLGRIKCNNVMAGNGCPVLWCNLGTESVERQTTHANNKV